MRQPDMFGRHFGTEVRKLVRRADPDTSKAAACAVDTTRLEELVLQTIRGYGKRGCISDDVRRAHPGLPYSSVTARFKALVEKGFVRITDERRKGESGRGQRVMVAVD